MKILKIIKYVVIIGIVFQLKVLAFEKVGTTSFQFLKVTTTARAHALSGAYATLGNSSEAVFWNPANLVRVENFSASFGYADWFIDVKHFSFSAAFTTDNWGTFGLFGMIADVGEIQETKVSSLGYVNGVYNPGLTGNVFSPKSTVIGLSYAKSLNDRFSFGVNIKYAHEDLVFESTGAIIFDGGLAFDTGFRSIVIGASLKHFGGDIKYVDRSYPLPQTLNIGISTYLFSSYDALISDAGNHSVLVSYDLIQPRDFDQQHAVALEYAFNDMIFLRGGYTFNSDQEGLSAGAGVNYKGYKIDYAYNDYGQYLDSVHRVTIGVNFK